MSSKNVKLGADFWKFWTGQTVSSLGSSFTAFALPLIIFRLTGSAVSLAISTATNYLPFLFFGLIIGAWIDRTNRKRLMIILDACRALLIATVTLLAFLNLLSVWWIYALGFITATMSVAYSTAISAAVPSLTKKQNLAAVNGRVAASSSAANALGPVLAGLLVTLMPLQTLLLFDTLSFAISAVLLTLVKTSFNAVYKQARTTTILQDITVGLHYVFQHPVLRYIVLMLVASNFLTPTIFAQMVFYGKERFGTTDSQISLFYSAGSVGVVTFSLLAGRLSKIWSFGTLALGALMGAGLITVALALVPIYWLALPLCLLYSGTFSLFDINYVSLRQTIVPDELLGRVVSVSRMCGFSAAPLGVFVGGLLIDRTHNIALIYGIIGALVCGLAVAFAFSPLGHTDHYLTHTQNIETA